MNLFILHTFLLIFYDLVFVLYKEFYSVGIFVWGGGVCFIGWYVFIGHAWWCIHILPNCCFIFQMLSIATVHVKKNIQKYKKKQKKNEVE